ncbi:FHA domain-containing protein [Arthrobacter sp. CG_A4]|uniref:FHA domain-containing protein n=1 Tax=Arthrobacter sp. CG_A4 TaxID=3071706 RepID=UPI002E0478A2|nr:hypothetical protein [Arthrobacter sp. CG_A4]
MASVNAPAAARYTPGTWLGVVRSGTVVLLPPDTTPALVESLWELLATGPEAHEVLDAVTSASGVSLSRMPWFGIVDARNAMHVFLRGDIDLRVQMPAGPMELSGRDVTTWTERRFVSAAGYAVGIPGAGADTVVSGGSTLDLPLGDGVVRLQGLRMDVSGSAASDVAPAPASAVAPASPPEADAAVEVVPTPELPTVAEVDIAAVPGEHGASADTMLELDEEDEEFDPDLRGTMQESEPEAEPEPEADPEADPEPEPADSYDHLWEQTVMRTIEEAAVREDPDAGAESAVGSSTPAPSAPEPATAQPAPAPGEGSAESDAAPGPTAAPRPVVPAGLIDSVPWHTGGNGSSSSASRTAVRPKAVPPKAVPPKVVPGQLQALAAQSEPDADHDGQTIMKGDLAAGPLRPAGTAPGAPRMPEPTTGPMVLARVCPQGHANPSTYSKCGRCSLPLPGDGVQVRRPRLGRMRLSTGELINLDQSLIVGRQPSVSRVQGAVMPRLVQVASPGGDISRSHVEVRLEGWHVMLCDLKATNGTVLVREGQPPRRLAQGEMAILLDGDIADVGDGISLRFEEIP